MDKNLGFSNKEVQKIVTPNRIDEEIAPLFVWAYCLPNVHFPASFWEVLNDRQTPA